jgi:hypothetical protein
VEEDVPIQFLPVGDRHPTGGHRCTALSGPFLLTSRKDPAGGRTTPSATLRLAVAVILGATLFGSLLAMLDGGDRTVSAALLVGVAVSILPILLRVLPPLRRDLQTGERPRYVVVTIVGVVVYVVLVAAAVTLVEL